MPSMTAPQSVIASSASWCSHRPPGSTGHVTSELSCAQALSQVPVQLSFIRGSRDREAIPRGVSWSDMLCSDQVEKPLYDP